MSSKDHIKYVRKVYNKEIELKRLADMKDNCLYKMDYMNWQDKGKIRLQHRQKYNEYLKGIDSYFNDRLEIEKRIIDKEKYVGDDRYLDNKFNKTIFPDKKGLA